MKKLLLPSLIASSFFLSSFALAEPPAGEMSKTYNQKAKKGKSAAHKHMDKKKAQMHKNAKKHKNVKKKMQKKDSFF